MKIQFTLPKDEDFFNRYATLTPILSKLGIIAQIISAITEIGIIYNIILSRVIEFIPIYAPLVATIGAIIGTAFLELGLRGFTPYSIKAFLYRRFRGLDLAMTFFILCVNGGLLFASGYLSFNGSTELVKLAAPIVQTVSTDKIDHDYKAKMTALQQSFSSDSMTVASGYQKQITAIEGRYNALIEKEETKLKQYERKEQRTGLSYATRKETVKGKMATIKAEKAQQIGKLEAARTGELKDLVRERKTGISIAESKHSSKTREIERENKKSADEASSTVNNYGLGLGWFTILCLLVFVFSVIISEIHKKGSGIGAVAIPNQYHFSDTIGSEFSNMVSDKYNYYLRSGIQWLADKTPPPPLPVAPPTLYDLAQAKQQRIAFTVEDAREQEYLLFNQVPELEATKARKRIRANNQPSVNGNKPPSSEPLPTDLQELIFQYLKASTDLRECNLHEQADKLALKADDVIKSYLGKAATPENITSLRNEVIGFLNGKNENPFAIHHQTRNPIGFQRNNGTPTAAVRTDDTTNKVPLRQPYDGTGLKDGERKCLHCGTAYIYKQHTQKYCSERCRITAWEGRTGKPLKKKKKR